MNSNSSMGHHEIISPNDGGRETLWIVISISLILILAFTGIQFNKASTHEESQHTELPIEAKRVLTDLRNAADEILFSSEKSKFPSIEELESWDLPPFAKTPGVKSQYTWNQVERHCYVGIPDQEENPVFILLFEKEASIYWKTQTTPVVNCHQNSDWIEDKPHV